MVNSAYEYFLSRGALPQLHQKLSEQSCKIAFLGNSVTAQKEGYRKFIIDLFDQTYNQKHQYINAGIGGVGSLASAFLTDDFVLRYQPDICFVECTVADIGEATPQQYIAASVEGIVQKIMAKNCHVCFLHLYNSHTDELRKENIISLYEAIANYYKLPSINISKAFSALVNSGKQKETDFVYDGIHTTEFGAKMTADVIFSAFEKISKEDFREDVFTMPFKSLTEHPFRHTQIIIPAAAMLLPSKNYKEKRFRGIIKYIEIDEQNEVRFEALDGIVLGVLIIADVECGVVLIESDSTAAYVQTYDQWCDKERIQAIIFDKPVSKGDACKISLSHLDKAARGANGTVNSMKKKGISLKIVGLMVVTKNESATKRNLW
jgi:hypothetical protein